MKLREIIWSDLAVQDLFEIKKYIAKNSIKNAEIFFQEIFTSTTDLLQFPEKGRIVPKLNKEFYREYFIGNYRVMYKIEEKLIIIAGIFHMSKNFDLDDLLKRK